MDKITSIKGNINTDKKLKEDFLSLSRSDKTEFLELTRLEMQKTRLRKKTSTGTDVGIILESKLQDGDVLDSERFIVVRQSKEIVACLTLYGIPKESSNLFEMHVFLGHVIGNRHRPISIKNNRIYFPIYNQAEIQTFRNLFGDYAKNINLEMQEQVFHPLRGMNVHEH